MYAVGACIAQRAFERKKTPQEICLQKFQFSCWNGKKLSDLEHLLKTKEAKYAITVAKNVKQLSRGFIGYANHYHATWMKKPPYWAKGKKPVKIIVLGVANVALESPQRPASIPPGRGWK